MGGRRAVCAASSDALHHRRSVAIGKATFVVISGPSLVGFRYPVFRGVAVNQVVARFLNLLFGANINDSHHFLIMLFVLALDLVEALRLLLTP